MNKLVSFFNRFYLAILGLVVSVQTASAAGPLIDTTSIDLDTESLIAWTLVILAALAIVWAIRKMIKTTNRS